MVEAVQPTPAGYAPCMDRPEITYPTRWTYRIVGTDPLSIRSRVAVIAGERAYDLEPSKESSKGNFVSLVLEIQVSDEADRDAIFAALKSDPAIKLVL